MQLISIHAKLVIKKTIRRGLQSNFTKSVTGVYLCGIGNLKQMPFGIPMMWRIQKDHSTDCYFCRVGKPRNSNQKASKNVNYPNDIESVIRPIQHSEEITIPKPPTVLPVLDDLCVASDTGCDDKDEEYEPEEPIVDQPKRRNQAQVNGYVRDMEMSKEKAELSASRFKEMGWLEDGVIITHFRKRTDDLKRFLRWMISVIENYVIL